MLIITQCRILNLAKEFTVLNIQGINMDRKITIDRTKPLIGKGGFASVFHGTLNATPVAVKRIEHHKRCNDKEERALKMLNHPNIVQLYSIDDNEDFR